MKRDYLRAWRDRKAARTRQQPRAEIELPLIGLAAWSGTARLDVARGGTPGMTWVQTLLYSDADGPRFAVATHRRPPADMAKLKAALLRTLTHGGNPTDGGSWHDLQIVVDGDPALFVRHIDEVHGWAAIGNVNGKVCTLISWGVPITALSLTRLDPYHTPFEDRHR